jgi:hypothetical protein
VFEKFYLRLNTLTLALSRVAEVSNSTKLIVSRCVQGTYCKHKLTEILAKIGDMMKQHLVIGNGHSTIKI